MTPQKLKNSILQLAIQGRLVEQRPEEGTAQELYQQIQAEKQRLIKEGKIKKEKPLSEIIEDEKPFEIPESWMWVRLGDITSKLTDGSHNPPPNTGKGIPVISAKNVKNGLITLENVDRFTDDDGFIKENSRTNITKDDIIMGIIGGSIGNVAIYTHEIKVIAQRSIAIMRFEISTTFSKILLESPLVQNKLIASTSGSAQGGVYLGTLKNLPIPLPPLAEQKRIVTKIEELLPLVERYETAWTRLEDFNRRFPEDMKKSILQQAIQGKLVEQRPEEGTAQELYQQIQAEKQRLIREGKIKKEKPLPEITEDEKPFEIPESWMWMRVGNCGSWGSGATPLRTNLEYYNGTIPWLKTGDLNDGIVVETPEHITQLALEKTSVRLNPVGSVLMAMYGATIGKLGILGIEATTNQACCACIPYEGIYNKYLFYFLMASRTIFIKMGEGGAQPNISKEKIVNTSFPLPPLAEQKRIVARLEELLPLCERLK